MRRITAGFLKLAGALLLLLLLSGAVLPQDTQPQPSTRKVIFLDADTKTGEITRSVNSADAHIYLTLFQQEKADSTIEVRLDAGRLTRKDGVALAAPIPLKFSDGKEQAVLSLPYRTPLMVELSAALPQAAVYTGWVTLTYGNETYFHSLTLTRLSPADLVVLGGSGGVLSYQTAGTRLDAPVLIRLKDGEPAITDLLVTLQQLARSDGKPLGEAALTCSLCDGKPHSLAASSIETITLSASGLESATYDSVLLFTFGGRSQAAPVKIIRTAGTVTFNLEDISPVAIQRSLISYLGWIYPAWANDADLEVVITESAGLGSEVYYPQIESLQFTGDTGKPQAAGIDRLSVYQRGADGKLTDVVPFSSVTFRLKPNHDEILVYRLHGLQRAGTYQGKVVLPGKDQGRITKPFTVTVKENGILVLLVLALGVILSYLATDWQKVGRSLLLSTADLKRLKAAIPTYPEYSLDKAAWDALLAQIEETVCKSFLEHAFQKSQADSIQERARLLQAALRAYQEGRAFLTQHPVTLGMEKLDAALEQVKQVVQNAASTADERKTAQDGLVSQVKLLRAAAAAQAARSLQDELADLGAETPDLKALAESTRSSLEALAKPGSAGMDSLVYAEAEQSIAQVRRKLLDLRLRQMHLAITAFRQQSRQGFITPPETWQIVDGFVDQSTAILDLTEAALAEADDSTAWKLEAECRSVFLRASIEWLFVLVMDGSHPADLTSSQWNSLIDSSRLKETLEQARQEWAASRLEAARREYAQAWEIYAGVLVGWLAFRLEASLGLAQQRPEPVTQTQWQLLTPLLPPLIKELSDLRAALPLGGLPSSGKHRLYQEKRRLWLELQIRLVGALAAALKTFASQVERPDGEVSPSEASLGLAALIRARIAPVDAALEQARLNLASQPELAEQQALDATNQYQDLLALLKLPAPSKDVLKWMGSIRLESYSSGVSTRLLPAASSGLARQPGFGAFLHAPSANFFASIQASGQAIATWFNLDTSLENLDAASIEARIRTGDLLLQLLILAIAVGLGFNNLYLNAASFTAKDFITAFLWGFGIDQAIKGVAKVAAALKPAAQTNQNPPATP